MDAESLIQRLRGSSTEPPEASVIEEAERVIFETDDRRVRNAAALALLDGHHPKLEEHLNTLLSDVKLAKCSGTLVYCLIESDCSLKLSNVALLTQYGSWETRVELLMLTAKGRIVPDVDVQEALTEMSTFRDKLTDKDDWKIVDLAIDDVRAHLT